jgi:hypothetical protein
MPASLPFPMTQTISALQGAMLFVQGAWVAAAQTLTIAPQDLQRYLAGLLRFESLVYPLHGDMLAGEVVNLARDAFRIEHGTPALHLPEAIRWEQSRAAKRSTRGVYYLRIPLRQRTPRSRGSVIAATRRSVMPAPVYRVAKRLSPGQRLTAGPTTGQAIHAPGLQPYVPANPMNVRPGYTHAAIQEGLRRTPRGRGAVYGTFRTMTQDSPGWWLPAKPGIELAKQVQRQTAPMVQAMLAAAIQQDVEAEVRRRLGEIQLS